MSGHDAVTSVPVHELLARRWSPVVFETRPVEPAALRSLLEAARWAASCFNEQPWAYIVATRENTVQFEKLAGVLVEGNAWARQAPVLMLSVAKLHFDHNGKPNRHAGHDVGQASALLTVQATAFGLSVHQMAGFDAAKAREVFAIPDGWEPMAMIAVGYHDPNGPAPQALREREAKPRQRKALSSFVFTGRFGETSPIVK